MFFLFQQYLGRCVLSSMHQKMGTSRQTMGIILVMRSCLHVTKGIVLQGLKRESARKMEPGPEVSRDVDVSIYKLLRTEVNI